MRLRREWEGWTVLSFIMRFERDPDRDRFAALYQMNHTRMERLARQLLGD